MQADPQPVQIPQLRHDQVTADRLPFQGGTVLDTRAGRAPHLGVVLVEFPDKIVVWTVNLQDAHRVRGGGFYSGSYFDPSEANYARAEFRERW